MWNVWVEIPVEILGGNLEPLPRFCPTRDLENPTKISRRKIEMMSYSTKFMLKSEDDARKLATGLSQAFEDADVIANFPAELPTHDACMP